MTQVTRVGLICFFCIFGSGPIAGAYEIIEIHNPGRILGTITFTGQVPAPRTFTVQKNPEVCGHERSLAKVSVKNGKLQGAVLALQHVKQGKAFQEKSYQAQSPGQGEFQYQAGDRLALDIQTKNCNFGPFTGVLARDEPIQFSNNDSIKHTLHTYVKRGTKATILKTVHNRGIPPAAAIEETFTNRTLPHPGVVAVTCDRHDFMENWLYVIDNPYFAISDENGNFAIEDIPPGNYRLVVWHPVLGTLSQTVTVSPQKDANVRFGYRK